MFTRARAAAERRRPCESGRPSQESQSGRRGVPRLAGPDVGLIDPDYHHPQLLELRKLNPKALGITDNTKPSPLGGFGGAKERSEATRGPPPRRRESRRAHSKGNTAQQYYPQLRPFGLRPPQKNKPSKFGVQYYPQLRGFGGFPRGSKSKRACEVEAWTEPKKMARWYRRYRPIELSPNREALEPTAQVVNTATSSGSDRS